MRITLVGYRLWLEGAGSGGTCAPTSIVAEEPSMADLKVTTDAGQRAEEARRLIRDALAARQTSEPPARAGQDEIDRTRRVSEMLGDLAQMIDRMTDPTPRP